MPYRLIELEPRCKRLEFAFQFLRHMQSPLLLLRRLLYMLRKERQGKKSLLVKKMEFSEKVKESCW